MRSRNIIPLITLAVGWVGCAAAQDFEPPGWAGSEGTEYSEWLNFTEAFAAPNTPDVAGSTGNALLQQNTPGATITGSLNIYNPAGASAFTIVDSFETQPEIIVLHTRVSGTQLDVDSILLELDSEEGTMALKTVREELGSVPVPGFGSTVTSRWTWNLRGYDATDITIRFAATGAHCSFVAARLDVRSKPQSSSISQGEPAQDRWNYVFNATPGTRGAASAFRSVEEEGVRRHGHYVFGFDTSSTIEPGRGENAYEIVSAKVRLMTSSNFQVPYDPTFDPVATYLPETHPGHVADEDAGRPLELLGAGFRNGATAVTWTETDAYAPAGGERTVYPVSWNASGQELDASMNVNYAAPYEIRPFAVGAIAGAVAGDNVPHDTSVAFDINLSDPGVVAYLKHSLNIGKLYFTATSLNGGGQGERVFPEFHTRDSLLGDGPGLELEVRVYDARDTVAVTSLTPASPTSRTLRFASEEGRSYGIRWSEDLKTFHLVRDPLLTRPEAGVSEWVDDDEAAGPMRFYQVYLKP
jgi:hypothetical protein